jgi:hypothetical protein
MKKNMQLLVVAAIIAVTAYFIFFKKEKYTLTEISEKITELELPYSDDLIIKSYVKALNNNPEKSQEITENFKYFINKENLTDYQKKELKKLQDEIVNRT